MKLSRVFKTLLLSLSLSQASSPAALAGIPLPLHLFRPHTAMPLAAPVVSAAASSAATYMLLTRSSTELLLLPLKGLGVVLLSGSAALGAQKFVVSRGEMDSLAAAQLLGGIVGATSIGYLVLQEGVINTLYALLPVVVLGWKAQ